MAEKSEKSEVIVCKYGCSAQFPNDPSGRAKLMNHYQWECEKNPDRKEHKQKTALDRQLEVDKQEMKTLVRQDKSSREKEYSLDMSEALDKIILEVSGNNKRPGVIRMVERYMDDPKKSLEVLEETLRIADFRPAERVLILKNWAAHLKIPDQTDKLFDYDKTEGVTDKEKKDKKKEDEETGDAFDKELEKMHRDELRQLQILRMKKERRMIEKELEDPKPEPEKEKEEKQTLIVDGVSLKVTVNEMLAWKKYMSEEKEKEEERQRRKEEQKVKDQERLNKRDDDTVEWPIGDKVIKVRPETIPMLVMQQSQKKDDNPEMRVMMEELKQQREQMHQFQLQVFQKEIDELKQYANQDPLDRLFTQKERLEKLGIVQSGKMSAQERLLDMDRAKLDTLLKVVVDKSVSTQNKVDSLLNIVGPLAQDYVKEMILQMKQNRGVAGQEIQRTEQQTAETLKNLEEIDKAMNAAPAQKPVTVGKLADSQVGAQ